MSDLGWKADGIERAVACGGVALELYRRPGFTGGRAIRRADMNTQVGGFPAEDPHYFEADIEIVGRCDPHPQESDGQTKDRDQLAATESGSEPPPAARPGAQPR